MSDGDKSALALAEASEWSALQRMVRAHPVRAEELDDFGMMPLHWACTDTHVPLRAVKVLLDTFPLAAVLKNKGGLVPLHIAVKANAKAEVLRALVVAREDALCEETPAGETPADLAQHCGLAQDKVAFLVAAEQQMRGSGRAPRRVSDRYKALAFPVEQGHGHGNMESEAMWGITGASASSGSKSSAMSAVRSSAVPLPPRWRLDNRCNICQVKFTYFKNRHHCRSCGESVCSTHSNRRLPLKYIGLQTPQRVCILCYDEMREHGKPASAVVNMYANNGSKEPEDASGVAAMRRASKDALGVRSHPHADTQPPRGPLLRPTRSVLTLTTTAAPTSSSNRHQGAPTSSSASPSSVFDEDASNLQLVRPRAWTEMDALENMAHMQSQVRELQAHAHELHLAKTRLRFGIAVGSRATDHALQEKLIHERTVAELRANRMLDISRVSLADTDDDDDYIKIDDDDDELSEDDQDAVDEAMTCNYLGLALFEKGEFSSAVLEFRKSVALRPQDADVWYNLARALHGAGEFCDAEIAVRRALGLNDARSYAVLSLLGKILHSKGEDDKSIEVFREALGLMDHGDDSDSDDDVGSATVGWWTEFVELMLQREFFVRELEREWDLIASEEKKLEDAKKKVVAEWVSVEDAQREYNKKREAFEKVTREKFNFLPADNVVAFNVGGQLFKSTVKVWTRDRFSILAQLCTLKPKLPKLCAEEDAFFFDRDFWIFQFIYIFLRDNTLPDTVDVLRELYCEASFYRIGLLRHAIESKMIGDDAMAASVLVASSRVTPATDGTSSLPATHQSTSSASVLKSKTARFSRTSTSGHNYNELPDPFGFTSKKM